MVKAGLSRDIVLAAAVRIVDRDGLDTLTMRKLGEELGVEAMSLYRHVANKSDLLDGVYEALLASVSIPAQRGSWAGDLRALARAFRLMLREHPNAAILFAVRPAMSQASLAYVEAGLAILHGAGFTPKKSVSAFQSVLAFTVGHALGEHGARDLSEGATVDYEALPAATFPRIAAVRKVLATHDPADDFEFGLEAMLAGLETLRPRR